MSSPFPADLLLGLAFDNQLPPIVESELDQLITSLRQWSKNIHPTFKRHPFVSTDWAGNPTTQTWTLQPGDQNTYLYRVLNNIFEFTIWARTSSVGGVAAAELTVKFPAGFSAGADCSGACIVVDNGTQMAGRWYTTFSSTVITFQKADGSAWTASVDATEIYAQGYCIMELIGA